MIACVQNDTLREVSAIVTPDARLEPLAVDVDQADERDRRAADLRSEHRQIVERLFGIGIEDPVSPQRGETTRFVCGHGRVGRSMHCAPLSAMSRTSGTMAASDRRQPP